MVVKHIRMPFTTKHLFSLLSAQSQKGLSDSSAFESSISSAFETPGIEIEGKMLEFSHVSAETKQTNIQIYPNLGYCQKYLIKMSAQHHE